MPRSTYRVAVSGDGNLSRFVKVAGHSERPKRRTALMPADATGTRYRKSVVHPVETKELLMSGFNNIKIGRDVRKGPLRGYQIFTLSFEERATCPSTCRHWRDCYGNNMPFAKRLDHRTPQLLTLLEAEIDKKLHRSSCIGMLIRLHALGDFYDAAYVRFWERMLARYDNLAVWGYTAWHPGTEIGDEIARLLTRFGHRFSIRYSDGGMATHSTVSIEKVEDCPPDAFVCPEQTEKTRACATCGACWQTSKNVAFLAH